MAERAPRGLQETGGNEPDFFWLGEEGENASLVEVVDHVLDQGVVLTGEIVLGLAGVDLVYLRLDLLVGAADRVFGDHLKSPDKDAE